MKFANNDIYVGEWLKDRINGNGTYVFWDASRYIGEFANGLRAGFGILVMASGDQYEGCWARDIREGDGKQFYSSLN